MGLIRFANQINLADRMAPAGDDVCALMAAVDIVMLLGHDGPPPTTTAVAMASGAAIVAADTPAARNTLADGQNALLVDADVPREVARAAMMIVSDERLAERLVAAGRSLAADRHDADAVRRQWLNLDRSLLPLGRRASQ